jgi:hypothetical protein
MAQDGQRLHATCECRHFPMAVKLIYTLFVGVLVPFYWSFYGPANFLWLCDIALLLTVVALWWESRFLVSMQLIAVFLPSMIWLADLLTRLLTGQFLTRWTHYMFRPDIPVVIRILSLYHGWLPFLLLWMVWRIGYDNRGWIAQTVLTWIVLPICFFFTDSIRALNGVFGASGEYPQTWMAPGVWLLVMMAVYPICVYLPSHLIFRRLFAKRFYPPLKSETVRG